MIFCNLGIFNLSLDFEESPTDMKSIQEIIDQINHLESELNDQLRIHKDHLLHDFEEKKKYFEDELTKQQKRFRMGLIKYLWTADARSFLAAPFYIF